MNAIFFAIVLLSFLVAGYRQITITRRPPATATPMELLSTGMIEAAKGSVTLALGLVGVMALFLGLMKVAEAGGLLTVIARLLRPVMIRLFPEVPPDHPAMGAIIMNLSANVMGLGNAATPFGIRAMQELDKLNPHKGTATNAMALFLAINTSSITLSADGRYRASRIRRLARSGGHPAHHSVSRRFARPISCRSSLPNSTAAIWPVASCPCRTTETASARRPNRRFAARRYSGNSGSEAVASTRPPAFPVAEGQAYPMWATMTCHR